MHNRRPSTFTNLSEPIGRSATLPTTVAPELGRTATWVRLLMPGTVRVQVSLKSSDHITFLLTHFFRQSATTVQRRRDRSPRRRRHVGAAVLRSGGADRIGAHGGRASPLPRRRVAPRELHPDRPTRGAESRREP